MILAPLAIPRFEQPQDGARLDPTHPIGSRFFAAYMPGISNANLAVRGGPGALASSAAGFSSLPLGMRARSITALNGGIAGGATKGMAYPITMVWAGRINSTIGSTALVSLNAASVPGATFFLLAGGSSTQVSLLVRNNFGTQASVLVNVPGGSALGVELVVVAQVLSATSHKICVNGSSVVTVTTNVGALGVAYDRLTLSATNAANNVDHTFAGFWSGDPLTDDQMVELSTGLTNSIWPMFEPQRFWVPVSSGAAPVSLNTSLGAAVQLARSASASAGAAVQTSGTQTAVADAAVSLAFQAQADLDAVVQRSAAATSSLAAAILEGQQRTTSLDAAVNLARQAQAALEAAVSAQREATASVSAQITTSPTLGTSVSGFVLAGGSLNAAISTAILSQAQHTFGADAGVMVPALESTGLSGALYQAQQATATLGAVLQTLRSGTASMSAQVQDGSTLSVGAQAAIRHSQSTTAAVSAALRASGLASTSLAAAVALRQFLTASLSGAVRAQRSAVTGLSANIFDPGAAIPPAPFTRRIVAGAALRVVESGARRIVRG